MSVDLDGQVVLGDNYDNAMTIAPNLALVIDLVFSRTANSDVGLGVEYQKERPWFGEQTIQFTPIYGFINHYGSSRTRGPQPYSQAASVITISPDPTAKVHSLNPKAVCTTSWVSASTFKINFGSKQIIPLLKVRKRRLW